MRKERVAILEGVRTPFCKSGGVFKDWGADDLGAFTIRELLNRIEIPKEEIDQLIFGNVLQPPHATNIARVLAVKGGVSTTVPALTVNRNCASGLDAVIAAANMIWMKEAEAVIAGGTESMSQFPVLFPKEMREFLTKFSKAKSWKQKLNAIFSFRPRFLKPEIPAIADPICGLTMGQTAELLARQFHVTRQEQDRYALLSQTRALEAEKRKIWQEEIVPIPVPPHFTIQQQDDGIRSDISLEGLSRLRPAFDALTGSVTAGNASQVTDGACALLLVSEEKVKKMGLRPLGYIREYSLSALEPSRMGLGPAFAITKLLDKMETDLKSIDLFEINEAFAAQIISVEKALASNDFAQKELGKGGALGELDYDKLNVNGGAIALGHPVGTSGARLVLTLLKELNRRKKERGIVSLCVGGGQGVAAFLEVV